MDDGRNIVGDARSDGERDAYDFYPTPSYVTEELLARERFPDPIWEPAAGDGAISRVLEDAGHEVISTELRTGEHVYGEGGIDFLDTSRTVPTIITNPPFSLAQPFIEHALNSTTDKVAIFAKLVLLESESRYRLFRDTPIQTVYVFSKRVTLSKHGEDISTGSMVAYAWFIWRHGYDGEPTIRWIYTDADGREEASLRTFGVN